jgi:hypothetical protein
LGQNLVVISFDFSPDNPGTILFIQLGPFQVQHLITVLMLLQILGE